VRRLPISPPGTHPLAESRHARCQLEDPTRAYLRSCTLPIELVASLDDSPKSRELMRLLARDRRLSTDQGRRRGRRRRAGPRSRSAASAATSRVRFAGIPLGHEFTSLVLALLQVGGHPPKVDAGGDRADPALDGDFRSRPTSRCPARTARTWCRR
jgi:alkyl hydroperoxide reductase subunit F